LPPFLATNSSKFCVDIDRLDIAFDFLLKCTGWKEISRVCDLLFFDFLALLDDGFFLVGDFWLFYICCLSAW